MLTNAYYTYTGNNHTMLGALSLYNIGRLKWIGIGI